MPSRVRPRRALPGLPALARLAMLAASLASPALARAAPAPATASAQSIVDRERAFEQAASDGGTRAAFLEYLADTAVRLTPLPLPGRAATEAGPAPAALRRRRPDLASISAGGDFGWASGPFLAYALSATEAPLASGHYLTVWRREEDGAWRVLLDGETPYALDDPLIARHLEVTPRLRRPGGGRPRTADCSAAFASLWQQKGRAAALKVFLADDARLLAAGVPPEDGRATWLAADPLAGARLTSMHTARTLSSAGGDVLVSYGEYHIGPRPDAPPQRYVFVHAWDVDKLCRLALEMLNPVR